MTKRLLRAMAMTSALGLVLASAAASGSQIIEAIGAEKCRVRAKSYEVEFLAPDTAAVEATAKVLVGGSPHPSPRALTLSADGKDCPDARCDFRAKKGQSYRLVARSKAGRYDHLCIVVARPSALTEGWDSPEEEGQ